MARNPLLTLGAGVGVEIRGNDLQVALVKSRWKGVVVDGKTTLHDFRRRPAADWGAEYQSFLKSHGFRDLPVTLMLPRQEVIVRLLSLPAPTRAELRSAVRFQIDTLHPYGEENVYYGFAPLGPRSREGSAEAGSAAAPARRDVAVVIVERSLIEGYADLFAEAGVKLRAITVGAAAYWGAVRFPNARRQEPFLLVDEQGSAFELYGESQARPFFSASFDSGAMPLEKAVAAAAAELRLPEGEAVPLLVCGERSIPSPLAPEQVLGSPLQAPAEFDLGRDAAVFATALSAACPRWGWRVNLLPPARRSASSRWPIAATATAAASVGAVALLLFLRGPIQDRRYEQALEREIKRLETVEREVRALEQQAQKARAQRAELESFRRRPEADLALVTEISRRLPKTAWINGIEVNDDSVQLTGQADAAAPLLGLLDSSGVLTGASFASSITRADNREQFRIRAARRSGPLRPEAAAPPPAGPPASGHSPAPAAHSGI